MTGHTPRQREILRLMGVDIWHRREMAGTPDPVEAPDIASPVSKPVTSPTTESVMEPGSAIESDDSLAAVATEVAACERCPLHATRTHPVPGVGAPRADWMFVGEAPGQNEDLQGEPFVGRAGQLLDRMIAALGMQREQVYIANVLKCRPPGNRDPLPEEVQQCEPYLHRQLRLIRPKVIVALGGVSAKALLRTDQPVGKMRGQVFHYGPDDIPLVVTYHPAYLLRSPAQKAKVWDDLWQARQLVTA